MGTALDAAWLRMLAVVLVLAQPFALFAPWAHRRHTYGVAPTSSGLDLPATRQLLRVTGGDARAYNAVLVLAILLAVVIPVLAWSGYRVGMQIGLGLSALQLVVILLTRLRHLPAGWVLGGGFWLAAAFAVGAVFTWVAALATPPDQPRRTASTG